MRMIHWFAINVLILLTSVLSIITASGTGIGILTPLAWIVLVIAMIMFVNWIGMIQWAVYNILVMLMCAFVLLDQSVGIKIGLLSPIAWLVAVVTFVLILKDVLLMRMR